MDNDNIERDNDLEFRKLEQEINEHRFHRRNTPIHITQNKIDCFRKQLDSFQEKLHYCHISKENVLEFNKILFSLHNLYKEISYQRDDGMYKKYVENLNKKDSSD